MDQTNVIKYGDEFHTPQRKQKFHPEKVSPDLFLLHILSVEDSDQGRYHCAVEEWFLSTSGTWQKIGGQRSGLTELKLRPTGKPCECIVTCLSVGGSPSLDQRLWSIT
jgi:immunoglobulin superfamily protein 2/3